MVTLADETSGLLGADMLFSIVDFFGELVLVSKLMSSSSQDLKICKIYRCYVIWGQSLYIAMVPLLVALSGLCKDISSPQ